MLGNIGLTIFLIHNIFAQTSGEEFKDQQPIVVEIEKQSDSPLLVTAINVDNSNSNYQLVNFSVQNISGKPIKGFVIWGKSKNTGKIITNFFPVKPFQANAIFTGEMAIERENIQPEQKLLIAVDYVQFTSGKFWGENLQQQSEFIAGGIDGEEFAIEQIKKMIESDGLVSLNPMLEKPLADVEISLPGESKTKGERWQKGFSNGYKGVISSLKSLDKKESKNILEKLNELQKNLQNERRNEQ